MRALAGNPVELANVLFRPIADFDRFRDGSGVDAVLFFSNTLVGVVTGLLLRSRLIGCLVLLPLSIANFIGAEQQLHAAHPDQLNSTSALAIPLAFGFTFLVGGIGLGIGRVARRHGAVALAALRKAFSERFS